ncbi:serine hydrolase domain-containing protein [Bacteroidota bacterium]
MSLARIVQLTLIIITCSSSILPAQDQTQISPKYVKIQNKLDKAVRDGLIGVSCYIKHPKFGPWMGFSGYSDISNKTPLAEDNIFYLASISKTYMATATLICEQNGLLNLEDSISMYLPFEIIENVPNAKLLTIRHLLNMTSGIPNYDKNPDLNKTYLNHEISLDTISHLEILREYIFEEDPYFYPGSDYNYSSTNYMLLARIIDSVTNSSHAEIFSQMFNDFGLEKTYYKNEIPSNGKLVMAYGDLDSNGELEDISEMQHETTNWFIGDDGVMASITDCAKFMEELIKGKILNEKNTNEMLTWVMPVDPDYGLGLMYDKSFPYNEAIGHSGVAIGATSDVYYFPKQDITVAILSNTGKRDGDVKYRKAYNKLRRKIVFKLFIL